jgi:hypothetical protein
VLKLNEISNGVVSNAKEKQNIKMRIRDIKIEEKIRAIMEKTRKESEIKLLSEKR